MLKTSIGVAGAMLPNPLGLSAQMAPASTKKMNVLFVIVDDLRPQLGCFGHKQMVTPNIDGLASTSVTFHSNYCQQAVCSPSRTSLLTGYRPDTTKVYDLVTFFRKTMSDVVTLPQQFKNHGYLTQAVGKVFHEDLNDPASWSIPADFDTSVEEFEQYQSAESYRQEAERLHQLSSHGLVYGPAFEAIDAPDSNYLDGRIAEEAIRRLRIQSAKKSDTPFFLAVGFHKPHLPFVAPKKYWNLYDPDKIELPNHRQKPKNAPDLAMTNFEELRHYYGVPWDKSPLPQSLSRELIHGYYAGVSFVDAQIGRVINALKEEGFADNTIISLSVDHGWHLGDHGLWCKHTNFEHATRVPLIIHAPGMVSAHIDGLTENVDIFPTLCELAGLPTPDSLEGISLIPLMREPKRIWKKASFSQYPRAASMMGYSMRTAKHRYTRWVRREDSAIVAEELYDYQIDSDETTNWILSPNHREVLHSLRLQRAAGWMSAKPPGRSLSADRPNAPTPHGSKSQ
jgi:choline-sulfatase